MSSPASSTKPKPSAERLCSARKPSSDREGGESFLPQMPPPLFAEIDAPGVPPIRLADGTGQTLRIGGYGNEVNMVRHQASGTRFRW